MEDGTGHNVTGSSSNDNQYLTLTLMRIDGVIWSNP